MNPIEKAKELFTNYLILFPEFYNDLEYGYNDVKAKQCALIAVDEILNLNLGLSNCDENNWDIDKFYLEVKKEIEKL
jgi:hypothetical protein